MIEEVIIKSEESQRKKDKAPVTITWKGEPMIRNQSIRASVDEILKMSNILDVVKINIIGNPSTGKTTPIPDFFLSSGFGVHNSPKGSRSHRLRTF